MENDKIQLGEIYKNRFNPKDKMKKDVLWETLCKHFFQKYISPDDTVLDIGAGFCEFINKIKCDKKYALDLNPEIKKYANPDVIVINESVSDMTTFPDNSIDIAFASNFFEHLPDKKTFLETLIEINRVLKKGGKLLVLQPNIAYLHGKYWDFIDHHIPLTHASIAEALQLCNFKVIENRPRFLPYTTKSKLPTHPFFVKLYLLAKPAHLVLGKQAWVVGEKV